jgi:hypothetical protein
MPGKTTQHVLFGFDAIPGADRSMKKEVAIFMLSGFLTSIVCLFMMIPVAPLRNIFVVFLICNLVAGVVAGVPYGLKVQREKAFMTMLTDRLNEAILELTGDPTVRISTWTFQQRVDYGGSIPLNVNGVPGLELRLVGQKPGPRQVLAVVTQPDYGLDSFDLLLDTESRRKP